MRSRSQYHGLTPVGLALVCSAPCKISEHRWLDAKGYPLVERQGKRWHEYRWVYLQEVGPLLPGRVVHHMCSNTLCVEPTHLEQLTRSEHMSLHKRGYTHPGKYNDYGYVEVGYVPAFEAEDIYSKTLPIRPPIT
ncbi:MAG: HNH endonuclease signature motif containing protein, partial [Candidatus Thorarchaeota archaeon]